MIEATPVAFRQDCSTGKLKKVTFLVTTTPIDRAKLYLMQFTTLPESARQVSTKIP
jgi:hypothetical protein